MHVRAQRKGYTTMNKDSKIQKETFELVALLESLRREIKQSGYPSQVAIYRVEKNLKNCEKNLQNGLDFNSGRNTCESQRKAHIITETKDIKNAEEINISQVISMLKRTADGEEILRKIRLRHVIAREPQSENSISLRKLLKAKLITQLSVDICGKKLEYYVLSEKGKAIFAGLNFKKIRKNFPKLTTPEWMAFEDENKLDEGMLLQAAVIQAYLCEKGIKEYICFGFGKCNMIFACEITALEQIRYYCIIGLCNEDNNENSDLIGRMIDSGQVKEIVAISVDDSIIPESKGVNITFNETNLGLKEFRMRKAYG